MHACLYMIKVEETSKGRIKSEKNNYESLRA